MSVTPRSSFENPSKCNHCSQPYFKGHLANILVVEELLGLLLPILLLPKGKPQDKAPGFCVSLSLSLCLFACLVACLPACQLAYCLPLLLFFSHWQCACLSVCPFVCLLDFSSCLFSCQSLIYLACEFSLCTFPASASHGPCLARSGLPA